MVNEPYAAVVNTTGEIEPAELFHDLFTQVLQRIERENGDSEKCNPSGDDMISLLELESNYEKLTEEQQQDMMVFLSRFEQTKRMRWPRCVKSPEKLLNLVARMKNNQFAITDDSLNADIGCGVYINASLLNHSCRPNAFPIFLGTKLFIKALRNIKNDEGEFLASNEKFQIMFRNLHFVH